jgi:hypothetical protein
LSVEDKETETKKETRFQMPARYPFHVLLWILSFQLPLHVLCWCMMESWGKEEKADWLKCGPDLQNRCAYLHKEHNEKNVRRENILEISTISIEVPAAQKYYKLREKWNAFEKVGL